jgi:hypothetical protein
MGRITRRTVAKGAAWTDPVVVIGATAPAAAASLCIPDVQIIDEGSHKCCRGQPKDMQLVLQFTDSDCPVGTRCHIDQIQLGSNHNPSSGPGTSVVR